MNVFHLNGDEVSRRWSGSGRSRQGATSWSRSGNCRAIRSNGPASCERFDEVWAASHFVRQSVAAAVNRPVHPHAAGDRDRARYVLRSAAIRHPGELLRLSVLFSTVGRISCARTRKAVVGVLPPFADRAALGPHLPSYEATRRRGGITAEVHDFVASLRDLRGRVVVLEATMPEVEVHNLIRCCDAFVSLHRSEGFGLSLAEAMYLGLPVIGDWLLRERGLHDAGKLHPIGYRLVTVASRCIPSRGGPALGGAGPGRGSGVAWPELVDDPARAERSVAGRAGASGRRSATARRACAIRDGLTRSRMRANASNARLIDRRSQGPKIEARAGTATRRRTRRSTAERLASAAATEGGNAMAGILFRNCRVWPQFCRAGSLWVKTL